MAVIIEVDCRILAIVSEYLGPESSHLLEEILSILPKPRAVARDGVLGTVLDVRTKTCGLGLEKIWPWPSPWP